MFKLTQQKQQLKTFKLLKKVRVNNADMTIAIMNSAITMTDKMIAKY